MAEDENGNRIPTYMPPLRMRDHHFVAARMMAEGKPNFQIAAELGVNPAYISKWRKDGTFIEIVEKYRERIDELRDHVMTDVYRKAELLRQNALDRMNGRYEDEFEDVTHEQARADLNATNNMLQEKVTKSVHVHGDLKDLSLAELVESRKARANRLRSEALMEAAGIEVDRSDLSSALPAPSGDVAEPESHSETTPAPTNQTLAGTRGNDGEC